MTLAAIFAACTLLVFPAGGSGRFTLSPALWQSEQPASSPPDAQQEPTTPPAPEAKPEPPAKPAQETKPDQPPAESQAPPAEPQAESPAAAQPAASQPAAETAQPPSPTPATKTPTKKHRKKKPAPPSDGPTKVVVRDGGTSEPTAQISAGGVSKEQASHQLQNTTQLLAATNTNLQKLSSRPLNPGQQDTVKQIRTYMEQAKAATDAGDLQRGHNLASKAQMLSDDLLKQ